MFRRRLRGRLGSNASSDQFLLNRYSIERFKSYLLVYNDVTLSSNEVVNFQLKVDGFECKSTGAKFETE